MKCSSCAKNLCERKYANRHRCSGKDEKVSCTCTCQVSGTEEVLTSAASIGAGIAAAAGGVALTVVTGGLFAIVGGAALVGAGSSLILNPVQKQITGERMTLSDTVQDVALGATIGAITGPIGAGGSAMAKGASGMVKLGVRAGAGAIAGGVSGTVSETVRLVKGEEVSLGSFAKAAGIGALAGTVGGASTHVASNVSKQVSNGVAKAATRIGVQATTAAATDAGLQYADKGTVDPKQLLLNTAGQITVATTAEVSQNMSKRTNAYVKAVDAEVLGDKIDAAKKEINSLPSDVIEKEISKAKMYTENQMVNDELKGRGPIAQKEFDFKNPNLSGPERAQMATEKQLHKNIEGNLNKLRNHIVKNSDKLSTISRPDLIGENKNIHALHGDRVGQFAYDLAPPDPTTGVRSSERAVFTMNENKASFTGYTKEHNYGDLQQNNRRPVLNPYDALRPENFRSNLPRDEEETKHKEY